MYVCSLNTWIKRKPLSQYFSSFFFSWGFNIIEESVNYGQRLCCKVGKNTTYPFDMLRPYMIKDGRGTCKIEYKLIFSNLIRW